MANTKTAKKNILINERNRERNIHYKTRMRNHVRKALEAIEANTDNKEEAVKECLKIIDKTVTKGIIKKQTGARKKSRLALKLNKSNEEKSKEAPKKTKKATTTKAKKAAPKKPAAKKPVAPKKEVKAETEAVETK